MPRFCVQSKRMFAFLQPVQLRSCCFRCCLRKGQHRSPAMRRRQVPSTISRTARIKNPCRIWQGLRVELISVSAALSGLIAVLAIDGLIRRGAERHFGFLAALGADHRVHLPGVIAVTITASIPLAVLPCSSASGAPLGFVLKAFFLIKGLFVFREEKFCPTVSASKGFVCQ